jgi:hypothetical protein
MEYGVYPDCLYQCSALTQANAALCAGQLVSLKGWVHSLNRPAGSYLVSGVTLIFIAVQVSHHDAVLTFFSKINFLCLAAFA